VVQDGLIYVGGGVAPAGATVGNFAVYDPTADSWTALAALPTAVHVPAAGSDGERIFVMGGRTGSLGPQAGIDEVQAFDPGTGIWESSSAGELEPMALPRSSTGPAVFWDGELYVFGGADASTAFGDVQVYSPQSDSWRQDCPLEDPRHGAAVVFFESRTFLLGGSSGASAGALRTGEVFSPR
jgi:N-acetylneuraminic acid mutarotase